MRERLPGGTVAKTLHFNTRGPGIQSWSGNYVLHAHLLKIPYAAMKTEGSLYLS